MELVAGRRRRSGDSGAIGHCRTKEADNLQERHPGRCISLLHRHPLSPARVLSLGISFAPKTQRESRTKLNAERKETRGLGRDKNKKYRDKLINNLANLLHVSVYRVRRYQDSCDLEWGEAQKYTLSRETKEGCTRYRDHSD